MKLVFSRVVTKDIVVTKIVALVKESVNHLALILKPNLELTTDK